MPKYRGWVAQVMEMKEFDTDAEARAWAMAQRNKWKAQYPKQELYFEVDDCGTEEEE